jgi:hypothetical protein
VPIVPAQIHTVHALDLQGCAPAGWVYGNPMYVMAHVSDMELERLHGHVTRTTISAGKPPCRMIPCPPVHEDTSLLHKR